MKRLSTAESQSIGSVERGSRMNSKERFNIFREVCSLMDREEYYQAYLKLGELSDYCLQMSAKQTNEKMNEILNPIGLGV